MPTPAFTRRAAERWFLDNGLPSVLTRRARWRALWARSAPALTGYAAFMLARLVVYLLTGSVVVDIDGEPTTLEWVVLAVLVFCIPFAVATGWLVTRMQGYELRVVASTVAAAVVLASTVIDSDAFNVAFAAVGLLVVPLLTAAGLGSVLGWALRLAVSQLAAIGQLMLGALPVVLLTVLVFFNSPVWLMASSVTRPRLWLALVFLGTIAAVFLCSSTLERVRPMLESPTEPPEQAPPLTRVERLNVIFVLAVTQLAQVLMVAVVTVLIFFVLGLILLNSELLAAWTRNGRADGTILWMTVPVPDALIQTTLFLGALTFMYVSARAVGDADYRSHFLDPLIDDLRRTLVARNRYRAATAKTRSE